MTIVDPYNVPIFIQNFNQVSYLRKQIDWLLRAGYRRIIVVDNASNYDPLLQYYNEVSSAEEVTVLRRGDNDGKFALWNEGILDRFGVSGQFVFTDSDVVPDCAEQTLPIAAESVNGIFMCGCFERLVGTVAMMSELYRVAKPNPCFILRFRASPDSGRHEGWRKYISRAFARFAQPIQSSASSYLADWQLIRITLMIEAGLASDEGGAVPDHQLNQKLVKEVLLELRAIKPARPRDPWLFQVPEPTITQSSIGWESVF